MNSKQGYRLLPFFLLLYSMCVYICLLIFPPFLKCIISMNHIKKMMKKKVTCNFHSIIIIHQLTFSFHVLIPLNLISDRSIKSIACMWNYRHRVIKKILKDFPKGNSSHHFHSSNICFIFLHTQSPSLTTIIISSKVDNSWVI